MLGHVVQYPTELGGKAACFANLAKLVSDYGCGSDEYRELALGILKAGIGTDFVSTFCCEVLEAAYYLKDKDIFAEAMIHVAGQHGLFSEQIMELPPRLAVGVHRFASSLDSLVRRCWNSMTLDLRSHTLCQHLAVSFIHEYLHKEIDLFGPDSSAVYKALSYLHGPHAEVGLYKPSIVQSVGNIENALTKGEKSSKNSHNGRNLQNVRTALEEGVGEARLKSCFAAVLRDIRHNTELLLEGDRKLGYFTCLEFKGPFPWEEQSSETT